MDRLPDSKCDFCSAPNPRWCFPAESFYHKTNVTPVDKVIHAFMREEWAACDVCCSLIHNGKDRKLALRVYTSPDVARSLHAQLFKDDLVEEVIKMHDTFRRNRLHGPPSLIKSR